jgi:tetratricopeptide (TPR) repeat protein
MGLGWVRIQQGRFSEAAADFGEAREIYDDLGIRFDVAWAMAGVCHAQLHLGQYAEAIAQADKVYTLSREAKIRPNAAYSRFLLGCALLGEGRFVEAQKLAGESINRYRSINDNEISLALALSGYAAVVQDQLPLARERLYDALERALERGDTYNLWWILPALALLQAAQGRAEQAVALYGLALRYPFVARSRWFKEIVEAQLTPAATGLSPQVAAEAQARGSARDLWETASELLEGPSST